jgi:hypothetical protein
MQVKKLYIELPQELWDRVDESRWTLRTKTDRDTVIQLLENALDALESKAKKKPRGS